VTRAWGAISFLDPSRLRVPTERSAHSSPRSGAGASAGRMIVRFRSCAGSGRVLEYRLLDSLRRPKLSVEN
jgi:hypothetical protein